MDCTGLPNQAGPCGLRSPLQLLLHALSAFHMPAEHVVQGRVYWWQALEMLTIQPRGAAEKAGRKEQLNLMKRSVQVQMEGNKLLQIEAEG